ncbi:hypothetical protein LINPERHAP1_LOCUS22997 [Linum perenne]
MLLNFPTLRGDGIEFFTEGNCCTEVYFGILARKHVFHSLKDLGYQDARARNFQFYGSLMCELVTSKFLVSFVMEHGIEVD